MIEHANAPLTAPPPEALVPFEAIAARLQRQVAETAAAQGKSVRLLIEDGAVGLDGRLLGRLTEPLLHLLRNAVEHGIEPAAVRVRAGKPAQGTILLAVARRGNRLRVECLDDGRGLDLAALPLVPGPRHTNLGRVSERLREMHGRLEIDTWPNEGSSFILWAAATDRALSALSAPG